MDYKYNSIIENNNNNNNNNNHDTSFLDKPFEVKLERKRLLGQKIRIYLNN